MAVPFGSANLLTPVNLRPFGKVAGAPPMTEQLPFGTVVGEAVNPAPVGAMLSKSGDLLTGKAGDALLRKAA